MKYMGSKASMLAGTLGKSLLELAPESSRFVDLFAGSGAVSRFVAENVAIPVLAVDLMHFSGAVTAATIHREKPIDADALYQRWVGGAQKYLQGKSSLEAVSNTLNQPQSEDGVYQARELCLTHVDGGFIWSDYGGYYFSPLQALQLSAFYAALPPRAPHRTIALAALIRTASRASASPGHTAQPFRPTERLLPHVRTAWGIDVRTEIQRQLRMLGPRPARKRGQVYTGDSVEFAANNVQMNDLVFCDPPYSEAQYSRFYHVLEGIAVGGWPSVQGAGRAPVSADRPSSDFSRRPRAIEATRDLIFRLAEKKATVLWTYPEGERSNGLTVDDIRTAGANHFDVSETRIPMRHSTLGGAANGSLIGRGGRKDLHEILFLFTPKV